MNLVVRMTRHRRHVWDGYVIADTCGTDTSSPPRVGRTRHRHHDQVPPIAPERFAVDATERVRGPGVVGCRWVADCGRVRLAHRDGAAAPDQRRLADGVSARVCRLREDRQQVHGSDQ
jgi:hypothetical protein